MKNKQNLRPEDESDIDAFLDQVQLIHDSDFMQENREQKIELNWETETGLKISSNPIPSRETIEVFLMRIRPLIEYKERLYIGKILTYLIERADTEKEKAALTKLQFVIEQHRNKRLFSIRLKDKEYGMPDFVWLFLYSKYFHIDKDKQETIKQFENVLGPLPEVSALSQIGAYAGWALIIAKYIKNQRSRDSIAQLKKSEKSSTK